MYLVNNVTRALSMGYLVRFPKNHALLALLGNTLANMVELNVTTAVWGGTMIRSVVNLLRIAAHVSWENPILKKDRQHAFRAARAGSATKLAKIIADSATARRISRR